jgi:hypothetical protein
MSLDSSRTLPVTAPEHGQKAAVESFISASRLQAGTPTLVLPEIEILPTLPAPRGTEGNQRELLRQRRLRVKPDSLALLLVLAGQVYLGLPLIRSNTAFQDEALYLWAGRLQWAHWIHGAPVPPLAEYFSGAPVLYPPLAAAANALGGLAAARLLSMAFMLGATCLLWDITTLLYNRRAAFFACGAWVVLGPTQRLGAFATFDAMSLFLLALAAWCVVRAGARREVTRWLLAAATAALLANVAKYASAIFDPVIIALAGVTACPKPGGKAAAARWTAVLTYLATGAIALILIAGRPYALGISATTLARAGGQQNPVDVLGLSWQWIGVIIIAGACGAAMSLASSACPRQQALLLGLLVTAALLVPLQQARIHSTTSLDKHVDFGAWFAAVAAGYAIDRVLSCLQSRAARQLLACGFAIALVPIAAVGASQARGFFAWPNATAFIRVFTPLAEHTSGPMLVETSSVAEYYMPANVNWKRWSNTFSITTPNGQSAGYSLHGVTDVGNPSVYHHYIIDNYFGLVALNYSADGGLLDSLIVKWLNSDSRYRLVASVPYGSSHYDIWQRFPLPAKHYYRLHRTRNRHQLLHRHYRQPLPPRGDR